MEKLDLYDKDRIRQNKTMERNQKIPKGYYRTVVHVCVFNSDGKMLIQKRSKTKHCNPGLWDISAGGCVKAGETPSKGASRELFEEIGIKHNFEKETPNLTMNFDFGFDDYYVLKVDINIADLKFNDGEVEDAKWATLEEIQKLIETQKFAPFHKEFFPLLFAVKDKKGALII